MEEKDFLHALAKVFSELVDGAAATECWVLNREDPGLVKSLDKLSAAQASTVPEQGGASIAAHVDHLRYGMELVNRWTQGEQPFRDADYAASWKRITFSDSGWASRREAFRKEAHQWRDALTAERKLTQTEVTGIVASVVHIAYHLGAVRQLDRSLRGPAEAEKT